MNLSDPTVARRALRTELRRLREAAGLRQVDAAKAIDWSPSRIIQIEGGTTTPSYNDVRALVDLYGVKTQRQLGSLLKLAKQARSRSAFISYADVVAQGVREYVAREGAPLVVRHYEPRLTTGQLSVIESARSAHPRDAGGQMLQFYVEYLAYAAMGSAAVRDELQHRGTIGETEYSREILIADGIDLNSFEDWFDPFVLLAYIERARQRRIFSLGVTLVELRHLYRAMVLRALSALSVSYLPRAYGTATLNDARTIRGPDNLVDCPSTVTGALV